MESNITRDHIALEAMKIMLKEVTMDTTPWWKRFLRWFGIYHKEVCFGNCNKLAQSAYRLADAMIANR